jgi:DNA-binding NtrC family response regulator
MSPRPVDSNRFEALLGDHVAKEFVAHVCDTPDEPGELTAAEQATVTSFFSVLGVDFMNAAENERHLDQAATFLPILMALPSVDSNPRIQRILRLAGISNVVPNKEDEFGPWYLWDSLQAARIFVNKWLQPLAKRLDIRFSSQKIAELYLGFPERFRQYLNDLGQRAKAGEITDDSRGFRRFLRFEYLNYLLLGWDQIGGWRKELPKLIPRFFLLRTIRARWEEAEERMALHLREHLPELWYPQAKRWVGIYRAIRWLLDEHWPKRAPVLREIGDASGQIKFRLVQAALDNRTVLIVGEPGTGKDLAAQAIHQLRHGPNSQSRYRPVNCGATTSDLVRSELFGHERGSFSGADKRREGAFSEADQGTVFLDEIGEMPPDAQPYLLRALSSRKAARLGSDQEMDLRADVVAATNRDLAVLIAEGRFQQDLFDRLNGQSAVRLPTLSERHPDDIAAIWSSLLTKGAERAGLTPPDGTISPSEAALLAQRGRDGNVRALERLADRYVRWNQGAVVMAIADFLAMYDGAENKGEITRQTWPTVEDVAAARAAVGQAGSLDEVLKRLEDALIEKVVAECDGSLAEAERRLSWTHGRLQKRKQRSDS